MAVKAKEDKKNRIRTGHDGIGVGIFLAEVREHFGIGAGIVTEPIVVADSHVAEHFHRMLYLLRHRRRRRLRLR